MMSSRVTLLIEDNGADVDGAERSYRIGLPQSKLCLVPFNGSVINGTHNMEVVGKGKSNRKMA